MTYLIVLGILIAIAAFVSLGARQAADPWDELDDED